MLHCNIQPLLSIHNSLPFITYLTAKLVSQSCSLAMLITKAKHFLLNMIKCVKVLQNRLAVGFSCLEFDILLLPSFASYHHHPLSFDEPPSLLVINSHLLS